MPGEIKKATHQDGTEFEGPVAPAGGDPHAKRPADKKQGDMNADTSVAAKDKGKVFDSGKVSEEVTALFAGVEGLSEEFGVKAVVIIEGAINERVETIRAELVAESEAALEKALEEQATAYEQRIDSYMDYVCEQFIKENQLAIDAGIKTDIAEQVMASVVSIIESNGITLPEDKIDVAEALTAELAEAEQKLNKEMEANVALTEQVRGFQLKEAFAEVADGLSDASRDRLVKLSEGITFTDVDDYKKRVNILKESISTKKPTEAATLTEEVKTSPAKPTAPVSDRMAAYVSVLRS